jgi:ATP-dependent protease Clp ATPase subunit
MEGIVSHEISEKCSFCDETNHKVLVIHPRKKVAICNKCVGLCVDSIKDTRKHRRQKFNKGDS